MWLISLYAQGRESAEGKEVSGTLRCKTHD